MKLYARHGDLVISSADRPRDLMEDATDLVLAGSGSGAPHTLRGHCIFLREGNITYVHIHGPDSLTLEHQGRHLPIMLEPGDYMIGPLRERFDDSDRDVED